MALPETSFTKLMGIQYPIIVAPMFLVSNTAMIVAALENGCTAAFPALNFRTDEELRQAINEIKKASDKPFGVNLIVNKSNFKYKAQLSICIELKVDFIITSLGSPQEVIEQCKQHGIKVFCDVTDLKYAQKVEALGADALIAVNSQAGGHCGNLTPEQLIPLLVKNCKIPVISAGGVGTKEELQKVLALGAVGASIGTIFIASTESPVSAEYKKALVDYGAKDIVLTTKLSGSHLTVINTPYVQKVGTKATWFDHWLNKNKTIKKYFKLITALRGMSAIRKAAFSNTYETVWCAGPTIEHIHAIRPMKEIIKELVD